MPAQDLFTHIPGFEFKELLGGGGFGTVRRAVDKLGRDVAIKVLTLQLGPDEREASNRQFLREATTLAKLNHPNIVTLYAFDIDAIGRPYLVMEYVPGTPLHQLARSGELHLMEKLFIVLQTAKALHVAHSVKPHPVVHRDIKPHNLLIRADGTVKLIDFGIALAKGGSATASKDVAGSFPYMSPEHWQPPVSPWGDVFSLGVVLFELLTGTVPFATDEDTVPSAYNKIVSSDAAPPLSHYGDFPPGLEEVVARVLGKQRASSYEDAQQFGLALSRIYNRLKARFFVETIMQARDASHVGDFERAFDLTAKILAMDPGNDEAADLQSEINQSRLHTERRTRIRFICDRVEEALLNKKFDEAERGLVEALQVDPQSPTLASLQFRLRQALDLHHRIGELVSQADERQKAGRLQTAVRLVDEALALDRTNTLALNRRADLERIMAQEYQLCQQSRALLDESRFQEAFDLIRQAEALAPDSQRVKALKELAVRLLQEQVIRQEVDGLHGRAKACLDAGDMATARRELEVALAKYPDEKKLRDLRDRLEIMTATARREEAIQQECAAAERELRAGEAEAATTRVEQALRRFPTEKRLLRLADQARHQTVAQEQARRQAEFMAKAKQSLAANEPSAAVVTLEMAMAERFNDAELHELLEQARQAQKKLAIQQECTAAESLLTGGNAASALARVKTSLERFPGDHGLEELADLARRQVAALEHAKRRRDILLGAKQSLAVGDATGSILTLERALVEFAGDIEFQAALQQARHAHQEQIVQQECAETEWQLARGNAEPASIRIQRALERFPGNARLEQLANEARRQIAAQEQTRRKAEILAKARQTLAAGHPADAVRSLEEAAADFANDADVQAVLVHARRAEQEQIVSQECAEAERLLASGSADAASNRVKQALQRFPGNVRLEHLEDEAQHQIAAQERAKRKAEVLGMARRSLAAGDPTATIRILEVASGEFADDADLQECIMLARQALAQRITAADGAEAGESTTKESVDRASDLQFNGQHQNDGATLPGELAQKGARSGGNAAETVSKGKRSRQAAAKAGRKTAQSPARRRAEFLAQARRLLIEVDPVAAGMILEQALAEFADDAELQTLKREADGLREKKACQADADRLQGIVEDQLKAANLVSARRELVSALAKYPNHQKLLELRDRMEAMAAEAPTEEAIRQECTAAEQELAEGETTAAMMRIEQALGRFDGDASLLELYERIRLQISEQKRLSRRKQILQEAWRMLTAADSAGAIITLEKAQAEVGDADEFQILLETLRAREAAAATAKAREEEGVVTGEALPQDHATPPEHLDAPMLSATMLLNGAIAASSQPAPSPAQSEETAEPPPLFSGQPQSGKGLSVGIGVAVGLALLATIGYLVFRSNSVPTAPTAANQVTPSSGQGRIASTRRPSGKSPRVLPPAEFLAGNNGNLGPEAVLPKPPEAQYNPAAEVTLRGTVANVPSVQKNCVGGTCDHVMFATADGEVEVQIAPPAYLKKYQGAFAQGDQLVIVGSKITWNGSPLVLARSITWGNHELLVRGEDGTPLWTRMMAGENVQLSTAAVPVTTSPSRSGNLDHGSDIRAAIAEGDAYFGAWDYARAITAYEQCLRFDPANKVCRKKRLDAARALDAVKVGP